MTNVSHTNLHASKIPIMTHLWLNNLNNYVNLLFTPLVFAPSGAESPDLKSHAEIVKDSLSHSRSFRGLFCCCFLLNPCAEREKKKKTLTLWLSAGLFWTNAWTNSSGPMYPSLSCTPNTTEPSESFVLIGQKVANLCYLLIRYGFYSNFVNLFTAQCRFCPVSVTAV